MTSENSNMLKTDQKMGKLTKSQQDVPFNARVNQISIHATTVSKAHTTFARSDTFATEFDLEAEEYVPLPKGDVHKRKEVQCIFLHSNIIKHYRHGLGYPRRYST